APVAAAGAAAAESEESEEEDDTPTTTTDDEETTSGPDPEEARLRFGELAKAQKAVEKAIKKHGREHEKTVAELEKMGEVFKYFKLSPRQFEPLLTDIRATLARVRRHEKTIMNLCVRAGKMPRSTFIKSFPGNEVNLDWLEPFLSGKPYSEHLNAVKLDVQRAQKKIMAVEEETGVSLAEIKDINRRMSIGE